MLCCLLPACAAQVTYGTVDCAVVDAATITAACAALTAKTTAAHPSVTFSSCTGSCGSLVLQLQIDGSVADADVATAAAAVDADPSSVGIELVTTDGATLTLNPTTVVSQGVVAAVERAAVDTRAATTVTRKDETSKKGKKIKVKKVKKVKGKSKEATVKGKGKKAMIAKQVLAEQAIATAPARNQTRLALLAGLLGVVAVVAGLRKRGTPTPTPKSEPTEKSPLVARLTAPPHCAPADAV